MDGREQRGLTIAALCKLNPAGNGKWLVPSQSSPEKIYHVDPQQSTCTCLDHTDGGHKCKHQFAVEFVIRRELHADGSVTETQQITVTKRKTYPQVWPAYNAAQSIEKDRLQELLFDVCQGIDEPEREPTRRGRKPHTLRDQVFSCVFKVYCLFSTRRFSTDLRGAFERGYLARQVPGMKTAQMMENPALTPILKRLIGKTALPLRTVERDFAIDSSGFSTNKFTRWFDEKYNITRLKATWVKCHIACGVKTNVVCAVRILDKDAGDSPQFGPLVRQTKRDGFTIDEVSADKAYLSLENFETVAECGGTGFIAFKENSTGGAGGLFEKMFYYFKYQQTEYMAHYHKRSNVESTFSMVKKKFGDAVRSKTETAMVNEVLCKFVCHNLCCLIQEEHELGIDTVFWQERNNDAPAILSIGNRV